MTITKDERAKVLASEDVRVLQMALRASNDALDEMERERDEARSREAGNRVAAESHARRADEQRARAEAAEADAAAMREAGDGLHDDLVLYHPAADVIPKWNHARATDAGKALLMEVQELRAFKRENGGTVANAEGWRTWMRSMCHAIGIAPTWSWDAVDHAKALLARHAAPEAALRHEWDSAVDYGRTVEAERDALLAQVERLTAALEHAGRMASATVADLACNREADRAVCEDLRRQLTTPIVSSARAAERLFRSGVVGRYSALVDTPDGRVDIVMTIAALADVAKKGGAS